MVIAKKRVSGNKQQLIHLRMSRQAAQAELPGAWLHLLARLPSQHLHVNKDAPPPSPRPECQLLSTLRGRGLQHSQAGEAL